jgi:hypothetical protein
MTRGRGRPRKTAQPLALVPKTLACADCGHPHPFALEPGQRTDVVLLCPPCLAGRVRRVVAPA